MAQNSYRDRLRETLGLPAEEEGELTNPYTAVVQEDAERRKNHEHLQNAIRFATQRDPEKYAKALEAQNTVGVPAPVAETDTTTPNRLRERELLTKFERNPQLAEFFRSRSDALTVAQDEIHVFETIGRIVKESPFLLGAGVVSGAAGLLGLAETALQTESVGESPEAEAEALERAGRVSQFFRLTENRKKLEDIAETLRGTPAEGRIEEGVRQGVESVGQMIPAILTSLATGGSSTALVILGSEVAGQEAISAQAEGLSPDEALAYGAVQGTIEGLAETVGLGRLLRFIGGDEALRRSFVRFATKQLLLEVTEEQATTLAQDLTRMIAMEPDKTLKEFALERPDAAFDTLVSTVTAATIMTGSAGAISFRADRQQAQQEADEAKAGQKTLQQLHDTVGSSQVRRRAPQVIREFAEEFGGELTISASQLVTALEENGIELAAVRQAVPSIDAQIDNAAALDGDITIPVSEWLSGMAGEEFNQDLIPHLKTNPAGMSGQEAEDFAGQAEEALLAEEQDAAIAEQEQEQIAQEKAEIEVDIAEQLVAARPDLYSEEGSAAASAAVVGGFYESSAKIFKTSPKEIFQRFPVRVTSEQGASQFEQAVRQITRAQPFEKYDLRFLGTGEGAAAYGTGFYFATSEEVLNFYRETLGTEEVIVNGEPISSGRLFSPEDTAFNALTAAFKRNEENVFEAARFIIQQQLAAAEEDAKPFQRPSHFREALKQVDQLEEQGATVRAGTREVQAEIPEDEELLLWDSKFGEQSPEVQERIRALWERAGMQPDEGATGQQIYAALSSQFGDDLAASKALAQAGIPGHKYLDATSRRKPEGEQSFNFVVYDPEAIEIVQFAQEATGQPIGPFVEEVNQFNQAQGRAPIQISRVPVDTANSQRIADAYDAMEHSPDDPAVIASYDALRKGVEEQFRFLTETLGIEVEFTDDYQPYENSQEMAADVEQNKHLLIWQGGEPHALLDGEDNAKFRAVHDFFGHIVHTNPFGHQGEEQAWSAHAQMFAPEALGALATETRGQNAAVHFSSTVANDPALLNVDSLDAGLNFVEQKAGLLPEEFWQPPVFEQEGRGGITFNQDEAVIRLTEASDFSTFLHESGHLFLEMWSQVALSPEAPAEIQADVSTLLDWFGVKDLASWGAMTTEQRRPHHEKFARGFEKYLFQGNAPNEGLRSIFQRFRSWLRSIYESMSQLNVLLTPEVKEVMDRMVSAEATVTAAEQQRLATPMFDSRDLAGATEQEWDDYQALNLKATEQAIENVEKRSLRDMRWLRKAQARELKKLQADIVERRAEAREDAENEIMATPVRQAEKFLKTGLSEFNGDDLDYSKKPHKLLNEALPEVHDAWENLPKALRGKTGIHPDFAAQLFGFKSGTELVGELLDAQRETVEEQIEARTDTLMLERYGDLSDPQKLERAVDIAVHNDARIRMAATELKFLDESTKVTELQKAAKLFTDKIVNRETVGRLNPKRFSQAEARAAKASLKALREGNRVLAAMHKRNQILNGLAAKKAAQVAETIEKRNQYIKKFRRPKKALQNAVGGDTIRQIQKLMEQFQLREPSVVAEDISLRQWISEQPLVPDVAEWIFAGQQQDVEELTVERFFDMMDAVRSVETVGRKRQATLKSEQFQTINEAGDAFAARIRETARKTAPPETVPKNTWADTIKKGDLSLRTWNNIMRQLDGWEDGVVFDLMVRDKNAAAAFETTRLATAFKELKSLFRSVEHIPRRGVEVPGVGVMPWEARMMFVLNTGTEQNVRRLIDNGFVGGPDSLSPDQIQAVVDTLSKEEMDFVQKIWDFNDSFWPEISAKEKRLLGFAPPKVVARPVQTKHGTYRGGYQHIKYDSRVGQATTDNETNDAFETIARGRVSRATTPRGHLEERLKIVKDRKLRLSFDVITNHTRDVISDLAWHEWVVDASRLLDHSGVRSALLEAHGKEMLPHLRRQLKELTVGDHVAVNQIDNVARWLRGGYRTAILAFNTMTAMKQWIGASNAIQRQGVWFFAGATRLMGSAVRMNNVWKEITERSDFMASRFDPKSSITRETNELRNQITVDGKRRRQLKNAKDFVVNDVGFFALRNMQFTLDMAIWLGAEAQATHAGKDPQTAAALADEAVNATQGSGLRADRTAIENHPTGQLFSMFGSFFFRGYNLAREQVGKTRTVANVPALAASALVLIAMPSMLEHVLTTLLRSDDPEEELAVLGPYARAALSYSMNMVPVLRELSGTIEGYRYSGPAALGGISSYADLIDQVQQWEWDEGLYSAAIEAAGVTFHLPTAQVDRSVRGFIEWMERGENPEGILFGPRRESR